MGSGSSFRSVRWVMEAPALASTDQRRTCNPQGHRPGVLGMDLGPLVASFQVYFKTKAPCLSKQESDSKPRHAFHSIPYSNPKRTCPWYINGGSWRSVFTLSYAAARNLVALKLVPSSHRVRTQSQFVHPVALQLVTQLC